MIKYDSIGNYGVGIQTFWLVIGLFREVATTQQVL